MSLLSLLLRGCSFTRSLLSTYLYLNLMENMAESSSNSGKRSRSPTSETDPSKRLKLVEVVSVDDMFGKLAHLNLAGSVRKGKLIALGGYSDVFIGILKHYGDEELELEVAIKVLRIHLGKEEASFMKVALPVH